MIGAGRGLRGVIPSPILTGSLRYSDHPSSSFPVERKVLSRLAQAGGAELSA